MGQIAELAIPARAEYVSLVRLVVSALASSRRELDDDRLADLKLAVSEACTNAIEATGPVDASHVTVRCFDDAEHFDVEIADEGGGFDPAGLPDHPPVTDPRRLEFERGLGIPLIRALVDEVTFDSSGKGTAVRLRMRCTAVEPL